MTRSTTRITTGLAVLIVALMAATADARGHAAFLPSTAGAYALSVAAR